MKNTAVAFVLFIMATGFAAASDYSETLVLENERAAEAVVYADAKVDRNRKVGGLTVDEYIKSWEEFDGEPEKKLFSDKVLIKVPIVNQYPEMPVGCEISAATSVINYMGFTISDTDFAKKYFKIRSESDNFGFWYDSEDVFHGPDPELEFIGNPFGWGYGTYPAAIAKAMNTYFTNVGSLSKAYEADNLIEEDFIRLVDGGVPVIVWATMDMDSFDYRDPAVWLTPKNEEIVWYKGSHTLVLCGYDDDAFYFMDPNDKEEIMAFGKELFMTRFKEAGKKAVIVKY
ncbi:MAG: C39 family peptidase [Ruminococcus sp.]|jgi:uncharacterized protein YvpB|nr:C39 family peptidase [Ruminococcus sp.]